MVVFLVVAYPGNWVVADIVRLENGKLMEHWDVIQSEASVAESKSGLSRCSVPGSLSSERPTCGRIRAP